MRISEIYLARSQNFFDVPVPDGDYSTLANELVATCHVSKDWQSQASDLGLTANNYDVNADVLASQLVKNARALYADLISEYTLSQSSLPTEIGRKTTGKTTVTRSADSYTDTHGELERIDTHTVAQHTDETESNDYLSEASTSPTVEPTKKSETKHGAVTTTDDYAPISRTDVGGARHETTVTEGDTTKPETTEKMVTPEDLARRQQLWYVYALGKLIECVHRSIIQAQIVTEYLRG